MACGGIVVVDYGMGNLKSIYNAFKALGVAVKVSSDRNDIMNASAIVLPGVGAFADGMSNLNRLDITTALHRRVIEEHIPYLGICLGMQFLADVGEEYGETPGLGWIGGRVVRLQPGDERCKVPHMGWNELDICQRGSTLFRSVEQHTAYYFIHSYHFMPSQDTQHCISALTHHGGDVVAAVENGNVHGVQFHPEKSQGAGLILLKNFIDMVADCA